MYAHIIHIYSKKEEDDFLFIKLNGIENRILINKEKFDFMTKLVEKIIAKWPWLYTTYSEKNHWKPIPTYYNDQEKIEINGPIGRFMTREYNGAPGIYTKNTILDVSFHPKILYTISIDVYDLADDSFHFNELILYHSITYTFPSLSLTNLSSRSSHLNGFLKLFFQSFFTNILIIMKQNFIITTKQNGTDLLMNRKI